MVDFRSNWLQLSKAVLSINSLAEVLQQSHTSCV